jgi:hypothetical protein
MRLATDPSAATGTDEGSCLAAEPAGTGARLFIRRSGVGEENGL